MTGPRAGFAGLLAAAMLIAAAPASAQQPSGSPSASIEPILVVDAADTRIGYVDILGLGVEREDDTLVLTMLLAEAVLSDVLPSEERLDYVFILDTGGDTWSVSTSSGESGDLAGAVADVRSGTPVDRFPGTVTVDGSLLTIAVPMAVLGDPAELSICAMASVADRAGQPISLDAAPDQASGSCFPAPALASPLPTPSASSSLLAADATSAVASDEPAPATTTASAATFDEVFGGVAPEEIPFRYECDAGGTFTASDLAYGAPPIDPPLASFAGWQFVGLDRGVAQFVSPPVERTTSEEAPFQSQAFQQEESGYWSITSYGDCAPEAVFPRQGAVAGNWELATPDRPPAADATSFDIKVWSSGGCHSKVRVQGQPRVLVTGRAVLVAACDDPEIRAVVRREWTELYEAVARRSGADHVALRAWFAEGMLLSVPAAVGEFPPGINAAFPSRTALVDDSERAREARCGAGWPAEVRPG